jgi:hypothetical protein
VLLQTRGVAAFVVLTEPFCDQVDRVMTYHHPDRPLPVIVLDHPMQNLDEKGLDARAEQLADKIQRLLRGELPQ